MTAVTSPALTDHPKSTTAAALDPARAAPDRPRIKTVIRNILLTVPLVLPRLTRFIGTEKTFLTAD
jgi:hypothetical protein